MLGKSDQLEGRQESGDVNKNQSSSDSVDLQSILRDLPQVDEILNSEAIDCLKHALPHDCLKSAVRDVLEDIRASIKNGLTDDFSLPSSQDIAQRSCMRALSLIKPSLRRVINATGVIIHTNLGRSSLCDEAVEAVNDVAKGYCTLEYSTSKMERGSRHDHTEQLLCTLTGAEGAICVNNNAAAVMMVLNEFAKGHEAIVSRGELVEIGGSFRIPDIMSLSNAEMIEVGTTNKTHLCDYENRITDNTAMLLKVHPSNFSITGFVESVSIKDLKKIAVAENKKRKAQGDNDTKVLVYEDQGSGVLIEDEFFKKNGEHTITDSIHLGVDLVSCSGDKLLGGPQCGIILGKKEYIERLKKNPLARALRLDKMTLSALEATLRVYLDTEEAKKKIPTLRMLTESQNVVKERAEKLKNVLSEKIPTKKAKFEIIEEISRAGGGSLPMCDIPTFCVKMVFKKGDAFGADKHLIQESEPPIVPRLSQECLLFDARTLSENEFETIASSLEKYFEDAK